MTEFYIPQVGIVQGGSPFRLPDGRQFNGAWLAGADQEDLDAIEAVPVNRQARPAVDERFYIVTEQQDGPNITYDSAARPIADILARRLADLAAKRWQIETAGILLNGAVIRTDEASQAKIHAAFSRVQRNPALLVDFKAASGFVQIDAATMTAIADAAGDHVQACYSAEKAHTEALQALADVEDIEGLIDYDIDAGWPPTAADQN